MLNIELQPIFISVQIDVLQYMKVMHKDDDFYDSGA